jgi:magnesium chelatase family protein
VLLLGPAGVAQSRLARRLTTILPAMTLAEALDTTRLHRVAGRTGGRTVLVATGPCRAPIPHLQLRRDSRPLATFGVQM